MKKLFLTIAVFFIHSTAAYSARPIIHHPMITYITDIEGNWQRLVGAISRSKNIYIDENGELQFRDKDSIFVYGGDTIDLGSESLQVVEALVSFKKRYPNRVALLVGNRDLNKLRIPIELGEARRMNYPVVKALKTILEKSMGAKKAFEYRRTELKNRLKTEITDGDIVQSFENDLKPGSALREFIELGEMGLILGDTIFLHGAITEENFLKMPYSSKIIVGSVRDWLGSMQGWKSAELKDWRSIVDNPIYTTNPFMKQLRIDGAQNLIRYQRPIPGTSENLASTIYGRFSSRATGNQPRLPPKYIMKALMTAGIRRSIVGHTPYDSYPVKLRDPDTGFEVILADVNNPKDATLIELEEGNANILIDQPLIEGFSFHSPLTGMLTGDGYLVQGAFSNGSMRLFKVGKSFIPETKILSPEEAAQFEFKPPLHPKDCGSILSELSGAS